MRIAHAARGRVVVVLTGATLILGPLPLAATAAERVDVNFAAAMSASDAAVAVEKHGNHVVAIEWPSFDFGIVPSSDSPWFCCDAGGQFSWKWHVSQERGTLSGSFTVAHHFEPRQGVVRGQMTESGGSGVLHMTELSSGRKLVAAWTSAPVQPITDLSITIVVTGTMISSER